MRKPGRSGTIVLFLYSRLMMWMMETQRRYEIFLFRREGGKNGGSLNCSDCRRGRLCIIVVSMIGFLRRSFPEEAFDQEAEEVGEGIEGSVEADVAVGKLDAVVNVCEFFSLDQGV